MFIRGAEAGESLFLVDGIRISDPSAPDGSAVLGDLLVNNISRIEILRGPQSTLYGSDAIGGVVNVITQRGGTQPLQGTLEGDGGTYGTYRLNGAAHGTVGRARIRRCAQLLRHQRHFRGLRLRRQHRTRRISQLRCHRQSALPRQRFAQPRCARLLYQVAYRLRRLPAAGLQLHG